MVFAELLGGMINRGGEHFREAELRRHALENWQRENELQTRTNFLRENWANMTPEQQQAQLSGIEPLIGLKKGGLQALVQPAQAIHAIIPPQYAPPELGAPRTGEVTATPSTEAPTTIAGGKLAGQSIAAPANIQIGQIPTPAETATPSIFAPQPGYMAKSEPRLQMTPNQILARQRTEQDQADLEQKVQNIMNSPYLDERAKAVAIRSLYTPPGVIAAEERQVSGPSNTGLGVLTLISPDGSKQINVQPTRGGGGGYIDSSTGKPVDPASIAGWTKLYNQGVQLVPNAEGGETVINKTRIGQRMNQTGTTIGELANVRPAAANPQSQLQQVTTAQGPSVVSFTPSRSGPGTTQTVIPNAVKGNVPPLSEAEQAQIKGLATAANTLGELRDILPTIKTGPIWGRLRQVQMQYLGGFGTTPEERDAAIKIQTLLISAFDTAGKNFTGPEKQIFQQYYPQNTDTLETALSKMDNALGFINKTLEVRQGLLSPSQKQFYQMPEVPKPRSKTKAAGAGGNTPPPAGGGAGGAGQRREQRRPLPNGGYEYQHSIDGGKTWQPGRLQ